MPDFAETSLIYIYGDVAHTVYYVISGTLLQKLKNDGFRFIF